MTFTHVVASLLFATLLALPGSAVEPRPEGMAAVPPVQLLDAAYRGFGYNEAPRAVGQIAVADLGGEKLVTVRYRWRQEAGFSDWLTADAAYEGALEGGRERWSFSTPGLPPFFRGADFDLAVEYTVNGATYVDDNGGALFGVGAGYLDSAGHPPVRLGASAVVLRGAQYSPRGGGGYHVEVVTRIGAGAGKVTLVVTSDNWATTETIPMTHQYNLTDDQEQWSAALRGSRAAEMAIVYEVDGAQHWDNNHGRNHTLTPRW